MPVSNIVDMDGLSHAVSCLPAKQFLERAKVCLSHCHVVTPKSFSIITLGFSIRILNA